MIFGLWGCTVWLSDCHSEYSGGFDFHIDRNKGVDRKDFIVCKTRGMGSIPIGMETYHSLMAEH